MTEPIWGQWVIELDGTTVWSVGAPQTRTYDSMSPVQLPDPDTYPNYAVMLPILTARAMIGSHPWPFESTPDLKTIQFVKVRTRGGQMWVESSKATQIMKRWYQYQ